MPLRGDDSMVVPAPRIMTPVYCMDDRAAITALLHAARRLSEQGDPPAGDVYLVFTTDEVIGGIGGAYANLTLPGDLTTALEVGPAEAEYATICSGDPIIAYSAERVYDKRVVY